MAEVSVQKIDSNVPIPVHVEPVTKRVPIHELKVGESSIFDASDRSKVQSLASRLKKDGVAYTIRKVSDTECRIWRIK